MGCFNATASLTVSISLVAVELRFEVTHIGPVFATRRSYLKRLRVLRRITNALMLKYCRLQAQRILPVNASISSWLNCTVSVGVGFVETINILYQSATTGSQSVGQEQCGEIRSAPAQESRATICRASDEARHYGDEELG